MINSVSNNPVDASSFPFYKELLFLCLNVTFYFSFFIFSDIPVIFSFYNTLFHILYKTEKKRQILRCPLKTKFDITSSKDSTQFLTLFPTELSFLYFPIIRADIFILPIFRTETIPDRTKLDKTKSFIQMSCMHIGCTLFFLIDHFCLYKYFENPLL